MVNRNGFGIQSRRRDGFRVFNFKFQIARLRRSFLKLAPALHRTTWYSALPLCCLLFSGLLGAQMPLGTPTYNVNAKWVTDRGSQVYNVKAYGAKCDGVTDDSAAFAAAVAALPAGTPWPTLNTVGGGTLFIPASHTPCNLASARLAITQSNVLVSGYGATLLCNVNDDCVTLGSLSNALANWGIVIEGLAIEPGTGSAGHSAIRDNAQGTVIRDITNITNYSMYPSYPGFNHFFENDNDQSESIEHNWLNGNYLVCNSTYCGSTLWEPGPLSTNAGITFLSDFNFDPECSGNGIDWQDGNDLHMKGGVIQGFNQYAVRVFGGITNKYDSEQVHIEQGNCSNPLGNISVGALILGNATMSWHGGQLGAGLPVFTHTGSGSGNNFQWYIVGKNGSGQVTAPMAAGYNTNSAAGASDSNAVQWPHYGATSYTVLRQSAWGITTPAPFGTGNWAVAVDLAASSACNANGLCSFTDNVASPSSYTVTGNTGYNPLIGLWPGSVILSEGASYNGDALSTGGSFISPGGSTATLSGGSTSFYYQEPSPFSPGVTINAPGMGIYGQPFNATVLPGNYTPAGMQTKGAINLGNYASTYSGGGPTDLFTFLDSNPAKTAAYANQHPSYDIGDTAAGLDATGFTLRAPAAITQYIGSLPDNQSWLERLLPAIKVFRVPLGSFSVSQLSTISYHIQSDVGTGGTLSPNTQYCYRITSLDNLGETTADSEVCTTTANDGNSTHQIELDWQRAFASPGTVGFKIYGRTSGAEQYIATTPGVINGGNTGYYYWRDTGSVAPIGALPSANTTGKISATNVPLTGTLATTIATGSTSLGTPTINAGQCASPVSVTTGTAANVLSTDVIEASFNGNPTGVVGYEPGAMLAIIPYPGSGSVNFVVCNNTSSNITAGAVTLNWRVTR